MSEQLELKEILKEVRRIEILTSNLVNNVFAGEYESAFKGRGMDFDEVREYQPGDDIRMIDWNVTARAGQMYVKKFVEERELTVMLLVDASSSLNFGTAQRTKSTIATYICALLAFSAIKNNDKVGLVIFTNRIECSIPPKKGRKHVLALIRDLLYFQPQNRRTDLNCALEYLSRAIKRRSVVFLISDFHTQGYESALRIASKRHDLIAVNIIDERELEFPDVGLIELEDAETGARIIVDTHRADIQKRFAEIARQQQTEQRELFRETEINAINIVLRRGASEGGRRKAEGGRRKAEGGRRKAEGGRRKAEGGKWKVEGGIKIYSKPLMDFFHERARRK
ncbi:DUF58 domain-containing protein [Candidatus Poribacteria bacterium]|nr:DUF58 domain-containing protein [Candidatus Poribacteria bacterium]